MVMEYDTHAEQPFVVKQQSAQRKWMIAFRRRRSSSEIGTVSTSVESTLEDVSQNLAHFAPDQGASGPRTARTASYDECRGCLKYRTQSCSLKQPYRCQSEATKSVTFGSIALHEHAIQLGDNPSVSRGPPITIQWKASHTHVISVEDYEQSKPPSRSKQQMLLPRCLREDMLRHEGYCRSELKDVVEEVKKIKENRSKSAEDGRFWQKIKRIMKHCGGDDHTMDLTDARNIQVDKAF